MNGFHRSSVRASLLAATASALAFPMTAQSPSQTSSARERAAQLRELDAYIVKGAKAWNIPGMSVAVVKNDSVIFLKGYGVRARGAGSGSVDEHTLFGILSTTKAITAVALAMRVDDGKLAWNDPGEGSAHARHRARQRRSPVDARRPGARGNPATGSLSLAHVFDPRRICRTRPIRQRGGSRARRQHRVSIHPRAGHRPAVSTPSPTHPRHLHMTLHSKTRTAIAVSLALGAPFRPTPAQSIATARAFPSDSAVLAIITQRVKEKRSAGIVVGLLDADGTTRIVAYGDPGPGKLPLDGNSVFEIGSISKVFTSTALAQMVLDGTVKLDDPVQQFLPASVKLPERNGLKITLGNLSTQTSGLPPMPSNFNPRDGANPYADYTQQQMYDFLSGYTLIRDPGALFVYSNLGVALLGHALSRVASKTYEELQRERIWAPLGMSNTGVTLTPWMRDHLALGHDANGGVTSNWDLPTFAGAGAIRSTANDMLKFVAAAANTESGPLGKAMAFAQQPRAVAGGPQMRIGLNWITRYTASDTIVWHNGGTGGYRTFAGVKPSKKVGVVVLTNSGGAGADDIGMHLLDPSLPLAPAPAPVKHRTAIAVASAVLAKYVGQYQLAPGAVFDIALSGDTLTAKLADQPWFRLWAESATDFFYKEVDAQITFVLDARNTVTSLVLHQNGQNLAAPKIK